MSLCDPLQALWQAKNDAGRDITPKFVILGSCRGRESTLLQSYTRTLGHSKVDLAMNVYDKASDEDIRAGLKVASKKLLRTDLLPKDLLPSTPKQSEGSESAA